jgi:hypothetical protein
MPPAGTDWAKKSPATRPLFERGWRRRWASAAVVLAVLGSALALGGAHVRVVLSTSILILVAFALALLHGSVKRVPLPAALLAGLGLYSLLQSIPLPLTWLDHLNPHSADVWRRALRPFHETVSYGSLSLEPGASCMEAVKWLSYAVLFTLAAAYAKRSGSSAGITVVFSSAVVVALATLGHALVGAKTVFGVYEPVFLSGHIGPILNANCLAGYLNLGILCGLGLAFSTRDQEYKWLWLAGVAVMVGVVVLTGSRGGVLTLMLGVLVFVWCLVRGPLSRARRGRLRARDWASFGALAAGVAFSFLGTRTGFQALFDQDVEKLKLSVWVTQMVRDYPVFGIGRGAFEGVFPEYHAGAHNLIYTHPENIVAQWVTEWGPFVAVAAGAGFCWTLSPRRLGFGRGAASTGALIGICVLVLQNLVDLSLELMGPALAAVMILGSCWGERNEARSPERDGQRAAPKLGIIALAGALCLGLVFAAQRGLHPLSADRQAINEQHLGLAFEDESAVRGLWSSLREAMLRHPAEPYFPRVGALLALRTKSADPMPWVQRSLERCLTNGETHFIVGRVLAGRRALRQALLESRIAAEYNPRLSERIGRAVVHWTHDPQEIELAAPLNEDGSNVLVAAARQLALPDEVDVRLVLLRAAIKRAPASARPRRMLARELLNELNGPHCAGELQSACIDEILSHARALDAARPQAADALELFAALYMATAQPEEARKVLAPRCPRLEGVEAVRCWRALLGVLRIHSKDPSAVVSLARQFTSTACAVNQQCHEALIHAADALADVSEWALALSYYERAAQINPGARIFMKVAEIASKLGQVGVADRALTRAAAYAHGNAKLARQIGERRQALFRIIPAYP